MINFARFLTKPDNIMSKLFSLILSFALIVGLSACGGGSQNAEEGTTEEAATEEVVETPAEEAPATEEEATEEEATEEEATEEATEEAAQ